MKKLSILVTLFIFLFFPQFTQAAEGKQLIIINKTINKLAFFENGKLVKTFPIATGKTKSLTPEGTFPIVNKIKNRPYYKEGIPGGSPLNPLGDRWLGLNARGTYGTTYAIHGNNNPSSIGKYVSAGCVRMHNSDIHWLFDRVKLQTNVMIVSSSKTFDEIAKASGYQITIPPIKIIIDGRELQVPVGPFMENNRVLVPMRSIFTEIGAKVQWDNATKSITAMKDEKEILLKVNSNKVVINGTPYFLDVAPTIRQSTTFVPTRFVSESLGLTVKWDSKNRTVTLLSPSPPKPPEQTKVDVTVNGSDIEEGGFIEAGTTMVPLQKLFSITGASLQYDSATSSLVIIYRDKEMVVTAGETKAVIDGTFQTMPRPAVIVEGRLYAPARTIIDALSGSINFDQNRIIIEVP